MLIILATNENPVSVALRQATNSQYSHMAIIDGDRVIESNPIKGVRYVSIEAFKKAYPTYIVRQMDGNIQLARDLIGKPYDHEGLIGTACGDSSMQNPHKYLCNEVVGVAATGVNSTEGHRLLPDQFIALSWKVANNYQLGEA